MFKNLKIKAKLTLAFGLIIILTGLVGFFGISGLRTTEERVLKSEGVKQLVKKMFEVRVHEKSFGLDGDAESANEVKKGIREIKNLADKSKGLFDEKINKDQMDQVRNAADEYEVAFDNYVELENKKNRAMKRMRASNEEALRQAEAIGLDQRAQLSKILKENDLFLKDKMDKTGYANRLLKWLNQARAFRIQLMADNDKNVLKKWKDTNKNIFKLTREMRSRFKLAHNIKQADDILISYKIYEDELLHYLKTGSEEERTRLISAAREAQKQIEDIADDQKRQLEEAQNETQKKIADKLAKADDANQIIKLFLDARKNEKEVIISREKKYLDLVRKNIKTVLTISDRLKSRFIYQKNITQINDVETAIRNYKTEFEDFISLLGEQERAKGVMLNAASAAQKVNGAASLDQELKRNRETARSDAFVLFVALIAIGLGLILAIIISKAISEPLIKAADISDSVASGDISAEIEVVSTDETGQLLGSMKKMIQQLRLAKEEANKRDWIKTGQTKLAERQRNEKELEPLADSILSFFGEYINIQVGSVYIMTEEDFLRPVGSYALDSEELNKKFQLGTGLVGQVAKSKHEVLLQDVPEDQMVFKVDLGIGSVHPNSLFILPLMYENNVLGVLSLGAVEPFSEAQLDLLRTSAEGIAISLNAGLDQVRFLELLKETQEKSRTSKVFQDASDPITIEDQNGNIININSETERTYGYTREENIGMEIFDLIPFTHQNEARALHRKCWEGEEVRNVEGFRLTKDQRIVPVMITISRLTDENGQVVALATIAKDMTEQKKAEDEMRRMSKVFMDSADPITIENLEGVIIDLNNEAIKSYGYSREELIGKSIKTLVPENNYLQAEELLEKCKRGEEIRNIEGVRWTKSKQHIPVLLTFSQLRDESGQIIAIASMAKDITEQKEMAKELEDERRNLEIKVDERTEELKLAQSEAESANRSKSDFLANMSHEIRTPMNAIIGMSHLALETELSPKQKNYLDKIQMSAKNLLGIINDILDFSKIEAGKLDVEIIEFDLDEVLKNVGTIVQHKIHDKELEFLFNMEPDVPQHLIGDPLRLGQILTNLVGNSVKFTEKGSIIISVTTEKLEEEKITLRFSVKDTGIGMSSKQAEGLFKPFMQADTSTTRKYGGTGLGLSISKRLVEMMDGKIWAESKKNKGSDFLFTATFKIQKSHLQDNFRDRTNLKDLRVLVVEDSPDSLIVMERFLKTFEFKPYPVSNGQEGMDLLEKQNSKGEPIDLVISDYHMPDMDGLQFFNSVKKLKSLCKQPSFMIVTGDGREKAIDELESSQVDCYLFKPINRSDLFDAIIRIMNKQNIRKKDKEKVEKKAAKSNWENENIQLLLVEDNEINQEVAQELLERAGFSITIANNGKEGVEAAYKWDFDCILMDIQMPIMDGFEATKIIKTDTKNKNTPILAMTANAMVNDIEDCRNAGMDDHIPKPIDPKKLLSTLEKWLGDRISEAKDLSETTIDNKSSLEEMISNLPGINAEPALQRFSGNTKLYASTLVKFCENNQSVVESITRALESGDVDTAKREAHSVKGVSGLIGAERLFEVSGVLEQKIKEQNGEGVESYFRDFSEALQLVLTSLERVKDASKSDDSSSEEISEDVEIDTEKVKQLLKDVEFHLKESDAEVLESLEGLKEELKGCGVNAVIGDLEDKLSCYDFDEANDVLGDLAKSLNISLT
jgi:two-component system sensor histidine kinase/response regulator